jgi:hypothetical protein
LALVIFSLSAAIGCGGPSKVNVSLRKENQDLAHQLEVLKQQHAADTASLAAADQKQGTVPRLSNERINELFTVSSIQIDKLTAWRGDALKVYVVPKDADGDTIKAAGAITVEAFDLSKEDNQLLNKWDFAAADAGKNWHESFVVSGYALTCSAGAPIEASEITVRVTFKDTLTDRTLTAQRVIKTAASPTTTETR